MDVRLEEDGLKILLDPEERRVAEQHHPVFASYARLGVAMALRLVSVMSVMDMEKLLALVAETEDTPEALARLAADLLGEQFIQRMRRIMGDDNDRR